MASGRSGDTYASEQIVGNWVESRLLPGLEAEERDFLLDIGLFEWMDAALLDEVLERSDSLLRIKTMSVLVGMLEPVQSEGIGCLAPASVDPRALFETALPGNPAALSRDPPADRARARSKGPDRSGDAARG